VVLVLSGYASGKVIAKLAAIASLRTSRAVTLELALKLLSSFELEKLLVIEEESHQLEILGQTQLKLQSE